MQATNLTREEESAILSALESAQEVADILSEQVWVMRDLRIMQEHELATANPLDVVCGISPQFY